MSISRATTLFLVSAHLFISSATALNPSCAPGGNFDLSIWQLQLPIGSANNPDTIPPSQLEGCDGYQDTGHHYFFTESRDGALVMKAPGDPATTGCIHFAESKHCRTEFGEVKQWSTVASMNRLFVEILGQGGEEICIGQAFQGGDNPLKPIAEIYYKSNGDIQVGVERVDTGGSQQLTTVGNVPLNTSFTYELRYENGDLGIIINGGDYQALTTYFDTPHAFFKMGNYNQGDDAGDIHVFRLIVTHED